MMNSATSCRNSQAVVDDVQRSDTLSASGSFFMALPQPLDLSETMRSGQVFRWEWDGEWWWGVIGGDAFAIRSEKGGLRIHATASPREAEAALSDFFRLDDDLEAICRQFAQDAPLQEAVSRYPGLRLLRQDPWECLASFVCSQVSNIPRISRNLRSLAQAYGDPVELDGKTLRCFPTPRSIAEAGTEGLFDLGWGFRAKYLAGVAEAAAEGQLDLAALRRASYAEAKTALLTLKGVGEKVADCVLVFSLDKLEGFPLDRWVRRALEEWYAQSEKARYGDLLAWAQSKWGRNAGYAQQYLFHYRRLMGLPPSVKL